MMLEKLAYSLGRNDEKPNIDFAIELVNSKDKKQIKEIVNGLENVKKQIAHDCIKVLYEIGERDPALISDHVLVFIRLLKSRNNRLVWGAMTALSKIAHLRSKEIFENIEIVKKAYEKGSVITVDNSISVFAEISKANKEYEKVIFPIILNHLRNCRLKEVPQHCERSLVCVNKGNVKEFVTVLRERIEVLTETQRKRVTKILMETEKLI